MYVDAHSHPEMYSDDELVGVLETIERQRILTLGVSIDVPSFVRTEGIATRSDLVVPSFGIHPSEASIHVHSIDHLDRFVDRSPMLGEIGLDYRFVTDKSLYLAQQQVFRWMLHRARNQDKLVSIHCAGAEHDTAELLSESGVERAIIHWYSGPLDVLDTMIEMGLMFSIGVEVLHSDHIRDIARAIPADQLLTETDNPGGPQWVTGDRGYPDLIEEVVDELARVRGLVRDDLLATVRTNMARLIENDDHLKPWLQQMQA